MRGNSFRAGQGSRSVGVADCDVSVKDEHPVSHRRCCFSSVIREFGYGGDGQSVCALIFLIHGPNLGVAKDRKRTESGVGPTVY